MTDFQEAFQQLNAAQQKAVKTIDGPVMVIAGPGTGKTQLLSMRVAQILRATDSDPSNILCLTFTNKAAINMRERLYKLVGPESRHVTVKTFHSFAADIMNTYADHFWNGAPLTVAPDAVQLEVIRSILAELPLDNPLASTFAGTFTQIEQVKQALKLAKEAGLTPDKLRHIIQQNIKYLDEVEPQVVELLQAPLSAKKLPSLIDGLAALPVQTNLEDNLLLPLDTVMQESLAAAVVLDEPIGKTTHTGAWKRRWLQTEDGNKGMFDERRRNMWWLAVSDVYEQYRDKLHARGYYDYADMLIEVIQQLETHADMRANLQERYNYILIDEFQDTNAAQLRLAHLIADHHANNNRPNLMAVGDDDQSIFAFNGAELNNILSFQRSYPDTTVIVLEDNYRSSQEILNTAQTIIEQAEDRLVNRDKTITKNLRAQKAPGKPSTITHNSYPTRQHQQSEVARSIQQLWKENSGSIAVLARGHESLQQLASILAELNVPIRYERRSNVLDHPAVQQICLIARIAVGISHGDRNTVNVELAKLLRHPMWNISDSVLWKLALANYSSPDWLHSLLDHANPHLQNIASWLSWLSRISTQEPLGYTMEYILGMKEGEYLLSPFRDFYLSNKRPNLEYLEVLSAIEQLTAHTKEFAATHQPNLVDFVEFIELNLSNQRVIADESWFVSGDRSVELLTVYKAKGLEFDTVFVVDAVEDSWKPRTARRKSPANLGLQNYGEKYDDYVRLLYVAATRAKRNLFVTSYFTNDKGEAVLASPLLSTLPLNQIDQPGAEPITVLEESLRWPRLPEPDEKSLLADRLENFTLTASSLIDFLNVAEAGPSSFLERHLLRVPHPGSVAGSYGDAIHSALETAQRLVNTTGFRLEPVLDRFENTLENHQLSRNDFKRYHQKGLALLRDLFENQKIVLSKGSMAEQKLQDIIIGQAKVGGRLDRLDMPDKDSLVIVDYKTGKPLTSLQTKDSTKMVKAWRHQTQLGFYCLIAKESTAYRTRNTITAQMLYVEAEKPGQISLSYTPQPEDLSKLENLVSVVWEHIMKLDFPDTSKYTLDIKGVQQFEDDLLNGLI